MPRQALIAKNLWDISAYIELTTCKVCQDGPLCPTPTLPAELPSEITTLAVELTCSLCGHDMTIEFQVHRAASNSTGSDQPNPPEDQPSAIVDLAGWLTLFQVYLDRSSHASEAAASRKLAMDARLCLNEALWLCDANDDTPPPEAFFTPESLARFQAQPEHYSRQRLINLRAPLPKPSSS